MEEGSVKKEGKKKRFVYVHGGRAHQHEGDLAEARAGLTRYSMLQLLSTSLSGTK